MYDSCNGFLGKVVIFLGDLLQILAIAENTSKDSILRGLFISDALSQRFEKFYFTENMRLIAGQHIYTKTIQDIGLGRYSENVAEHDSPCDSIDGANIRVYGVKTITQKVANEYKNAIEFLYPNGFDPEIAATSMVLTVKNVHDDEWNKFIQTSNPSVIRRDYISTDSFCENDDGNGNLRNLLNCELIQQFNKSNVPLHKLTLKVNDICFLTKTISRKDGLVNNARVKIVALNEFNIGVQTLEGAKYEYVLGRSVHFFRMSYGQSFEVERRQFPLRLAYACTYNKSQAQTLAKVVCDVREALFAHGFLYVGMSRVRIAANMAFFSYDTQVEFDSIRKEHYVICVNVVLQEVLEYLKLQERFSFPVQEDSPLPRARSIAYEPQRSEGRLVQRVGDQPTRVVNIVPLQELRAMVIAVNQNNNGASKRKERS
jgi:hypothetical protein